MKSLGSRFAVIACGLLFLLAACSGNPRKPSREGDGDNAEKGGHAVGDVGGTGDGDGDGDGDADAGTADDAPYSCMPTTCEAESATCGRVADGCGGQLSCGTCGD